MRQVLQGVLLAVGYAVAFYYLRIASSAHWYLPAGLRFVALLLLPVRFWPYIYVGECAALFAVRWPDVERWGRPFIFVSTLTAMPPIAALVHFIRSHSSLPRICVGRDALAVLGGAALVAITTTIINACTTYGLMLEKPSSPAPYVIGIWVMGQYLGILMFAAPALLWCNRLASSGSSLRLLRDAAMATSLLLVAVAAARTNASDDFDVTTHAARMLTGIIAVTLTYRHGWRGAAIGTVVLTLAVGLTGRPDYDPSLLIAQQVVALVTSALLASGAVMTHNYEIALEEGSARRRAEDAGRRAWADNEAQNLEHTERAAATYDRIMRESDGILGDLRATRRSEDLMRLTGHLMASTRAATASLLHEIAPAIMFSADGLFGALRARELAAGINYRTSLWGNPDLLTRAGAINVYRVSTASVEHMSATDPTTVALRVRIGVWRGLIFTYIRVQGDSQTARTSKDTAAIARLRRRVTSHGGVLRNSNGEIAILLVDGSDDERKESWNERSARPAEFV